MSPHAGYIKPLFAVSFGEQQHRWVKLPASRRVRLDHGAASVREGSTSQRVLGQVGYMSFKT